MGFGDIKDSILWLLRLKRAKDAVDRYKKENGMDWGKNIAKGLKAVFLFALSAGVTAALAALTPEAVVAVFQAAGLPEYLVLAVQPLIFAGLTMLNNWWKHRNDPPV